MHFILLQEIIPQNKQETIPYFFDSNLFWNKSKNSLRSCMEEEMKVLSVSTYPSVSYTGAQSHQSHIPLFSPLPFHVAKVSNDQIKLLLTTPQSMVQENNRIHTHLVIHLHYLPFNWISAHYHPSLSPGWTKGFLKPAGDYACFMDLGLLLPLWKGYYK